jgi:hypothetical protein
VQEEIFMAAPTTEPMPEAAESAPVPVAPRPSAPEDAETSPPVAVEPPAPVVAEKPLAETISALETIAPPASVPAEPRWPGEQPSPISETAVLPEGMIMVETSPDRARIALVTAPEPELERLRPPRPAPIDTQEQPLVQIETRR